MWCCLGRGRPPCQPARGCRPESFHRAIMSLHWCGSTASSWLGLGLGSGSGGELGLGLSKGDREPPRQHQGGLPEPEPEPEP